MAAPDEKIAISSAENVDTIHQKSLEKEVIHDSSSNEGVDGERRGSVLFQSETKRRESVKNLTNNETGAIRNPLAGIPREILMQDVENYARNYNLEDILPLLKKGALVAQSPDFESLPELTEEERGFFRDEILKRWNHPKILYFTVALNSIAAAIQGWDQTGSNGANLSWPQAFGIPDDDNSICVEQQTCYINSWLIGLVNSMPYFAIFLFAAWVADPANNYFGRKKTIFGACIFSFLAPIGSAVTQNWRQLLVCRILLGIGMGVKEVTVPVFSAEVAPPGIRGALVMSWQLWVAFGIMLGTLSNLAVGSTGTLSWRLQLGSAFIPAVPLLFGVLFVPESPRWLMSKGKHREAYNSLCRFRNSHIQAARELYYVYSQMQEEELLIKSAGFNVKSNIFSRFLELFTVPRLRRASAAGGIVMYVVLPFFAQDGLTAFRLAQQMSGINIIAFYSSTVFVAAGATTQGALLASFGLVGIVNWLFAFPSLWAIDSFGRRALLLLTFPFMSIFLLASGLFYLIDSSSPAHLGLVALMIYLYDAAYSCGEGPMPFTYSAEVYPLSHREIGVGLLVAINNLAGTAVSLSFPAQLIAFGVTGAFGFYAALNALALVLIFLLMRETKQRTLEELDYVFGVPTRRHINYQVYEVLPYWFKTHILRKKGLKSPRLYNFEEVEVGPAELVKQKVSKA